MTIKRVEQYQTVYHDEELGGLSITENYLFFTAESFFDVYIYCYECQDEPTRDKLTKELRQDNENLNDNFVGIYKLNLKTKSLINYLEAIREFDSTDLAFKNYCDRVRNEYVDNKCY